MNIDLKKAERDALSMFLAKATAPAVVASMGLRFGGPEYDAAVRVWKELLKIGPFDPGCDDWSGNNGAGSCIAGNGGEISPSKVAVGDRAAGSSETAMGYQ